MHMSSYQSTVRSVYELRYALQPGMLPHKLGPLEKLELSCSEKLLGELLVTPLTNGKDPSAQLIGQTPTPTSETNSQQ